MNITEKVLNILCELSGLDVSDPKANLSNELYLDSLGMVTLLVMLEDELGIELDEADMNPFDLVTVEDVINLSEKYVGVKNEKV